MTYQSLSVSEIIQIMHVYNPTFNCVSDALILYLFQSGLNFSLPSGRSSSVSTLEAQLNGYSISEDDTIFLLLPSYAMQAMDTFIPL